MNERGEPAAAGTPAAAPEERLLSSAEEFAASTSKATVFFTNLLQGLLVACVVLWVMDVPRQVFNVSFYTEQLLNPHWGGRIAFPPHETLSVGMVSYGLDKAAAQAVWQPFLDWIAAAPENYRLAGKPTIADMAARKWWDAEFRKKYAADSIVSDPRPEAIIPASRAMHQTSPMRVPRPRLSPTPWASCARWRRNRRPPSRKAIPSRKIGSAPIGA